MNVALVVIDTLRKDYFDNYFDWLPGIRFENAWSPGHYTVPAHGGMFTGRYPREVGVNSRSESLDCGTSVLAEKLNRADLRTIAISGNPLVSPINNFDRGFSEFHFTGRAKSLDENIFPLREEVKKYDKNEIFRNLYLLSKCVLSDSSTVDSIRYGLELKNDSFHSIEDTIEIVRNLSFGSDDFLFMNIMDVHSPYKPPEKYQSGSYKKGSFRERLLAENDKILNDKENAYEDAVKYTSERYEVLFKILQQDFDYIITLSDHGELFGEHGTSKHYFGVFPELVHVPVSVYTDENNTDENNIHRNNKTVSLIDVYATILDLYNVKHDSRAQNMLKSGSGREVITESLGLRPSHLGRAKDSNIDSGVLDKINKPMRGIAIPENYYGYEDPSGDFIESGSKERTDAYIILEEIVQNMDTIEATNKHDNDIPNEMKEHLSDLGYM